MKITYDGTHDITTASRPWPDTPESRLSRKQHAILQSFPFPTTYDDIAGSPYIYIKQFFFNLLKYLQDIFMFMMEHIKKGFVFLVFRLFCDLQPHYV